MATSARTAAIKTQRAASSNLLKFTRGTRILSISDRTSSIANSVQNAEDKDVANRYADGLLSNDAYLTYLNSMLTRSGLSYADKVQVQNSIRDTQDKIGAEFMEAQYDAQADNTMAKASAAQKVAEYWKAKADSLVPGTPAHSVALQNYGTWTNRYESNFTAAGRTERAATRAKTEAEISMLDLTKSEEAIKASQMYQQLAQDAAADGDQVQADQYTAKANNLIDTANAAAATETRKGGLLSLAQIRNAWHDGTITYQEAINALSEVEAIAINSGDAAMQNSVNSLADTIYKDNEKGINRQMMGSLPVVYGRGGGGTGSVQGTNGKSWYENDQDYINATKSQLEKAGTLDSKSSTVLQMRLLVGRKLDLESRVSQLQALIDSKGEKAKVPYEGKNQSAIDVLRQVQSELNGDANNPFGEQLPYTPYARMGVNQLLATNPELAQEMANTYAPEGVDAATVSTLTGLINDQYANIVTYDKETGETKIERVPKDATFATGGYLPDAYGYYHQILKSEIMPSQFNSAQEAQDVLNQYYGGYGNVVGWKYDKEGKLTQATLQEVKSGKNIVAYGVQAPQRVEMPTGEMYVYDKDQQTYVAADENSRNALNMAKLNPNFQAEPDKIYTMEYLKKYIPQSEAEQQTLIDQQNAKLRTEQQIKGAETMDKLGNLVGIGVPGQKPLVSGTDIVKGGQAVYNYAKNTAIPEIQQHVVEPIKQAYNAIPQSVKTSVYNTVVPQPVRAAITYAPKIATALKPTIEKYTPGLTSPQAFASSFNQNIAQPVASAVKTAASGISNLFNQYIKPNLNIAGFKIFK